MFVDAAWVTALAAAGGAIVGGGITAGVLRVRVANGQRRKAAPRASDQVASRKVKVPRGAVSVLSALRSAGVVLSVHDEVVMLTGREGAYGLVEGDRLVSPALLDLVRDVRRDGTVRTRHLDVETDGDVRHLAARVARLNDDLVLLLLEDRTGAVRVETMRRDFVANVSHELKTPAGALTVLAEAVGDARDDPDAVRRFSERMEIETERLTRLVQQIIDLSRVQDDEVVAEAARVDVDALVAEAFDRMGVDASRKHLSLVQAGEHGLATTGHRAQLLIALGNLVENAVRYSKDYARVVVDTTAVRSQPDLPECDFVEISVTDQGVGIAENEQQRIFERFYRVDPARSRATGGTGLGLSIVKHVAAGHRGAVRVWSAPGRGSTFTISLPLAGAVDDGQDVGPAETGLPREQEQTT